jgi:hypothetical protein
MNAPNTAESTALATAGTQPYEIAQYSGTDAASLILGPSFERVQLFAGLMCKGSVTVPRHLQGNMGDCMAVTLQALGAHMNPFAFAQKTHLSQSGALGYEAQLVSAMVTQSGAVDGDPEYEFLGDWDKVLGKVEERKSDKGGKYYVATYTKADEAGLGVICRLRLKGEKQPRELKVMLTQCYPRFSTQWATDPKQQICYVAIRKWARLHKPGVILGVYTTDELDGDPVPEKFMGPADVVQPEAKPTARAQSASGLHEWTDDDMAKREPKIREFYSKGKTADEIIDFYSSKGALSAAHQKKIRDLAPVAKANDTAAEQVTDAEPKVTFADVAGQIARAGNEDDLAAAEDLIGSVTNPEHRAELVQKAGARRAELSKGA